MIGLYFGGQWFQTHFGNSFGNIELDAVLDENHEWQAEATQNPVEDGAPATDHVIERPDKLTLRGFVTDTPITLSQSISGTFNAAQVGNRTQAVFDLLHKLIKLKEPMTVYTKYKIYSDMVLTNLTTPRNASNGESIEFVAEFIHIRKVASKLVEIPKGINAKKTAKSDSATGRKAESKKDNGKKQAKQVDKPSSTLFRTLDRINRSTN